MVITRRASQVSGDVSNNRYLISACLIVGLVVIIILFMWVKYRLLPNTAIARTIELPSFPEEQRRKGLERYMLESMPVVTYRESLELDEIDGILKIHKSASHPDIPQGGISAKTGPEVPVIAKTEMGKEETTVQTSIISDGGIEVPREADAPRGIGPPAPRQCSVCTEDFVENEKVRILPCRHIYHKRCIDPWLLNFAGTCPLW